jgi:hypothetical protein
MEVYRIFNKTNDKSYIGVTIGSFKIRYNGCWWKFTHNEFLKRAVKKYGIQNFGVELLNNTAKSEKELYILEKRYIKQYNSYIPGGYNLTRGGGNPNPLTRQYKLIDYFGNLYSVNNLADFCRKNKLSYNAMLIIVCGYNNSHKGFALSTTPLNKIKNPNEKFEFKNIITKEIVKIKRCDLLKWCKSICVKPENINGVVNKRVLVSNNWKLRHSILPKNYLNYLKYQNIGFINPNGKLEKIEKINPFCKKNNLDKGGFYSLINHETLSYKGWILAENRDDFEKINNERHGRIHLLRLTSNNEVIKIKNIRNFCKQNKLNLNKMYDLTCGRLKTYNRFSTLKK